MATRSRKAGGAKRAPRPLVQLHIDVPLAFRRRVRATAKRNGMTVQGLVLKALAAQWGLGTRRSG